MSANHAQNGGSPADSWLAANRRYLEAELHRLRLLLRRRVLWLKQTWAHDPLQNYQGLVISENQAAALLAGEDLAAERKFYATDPEAVKVSQELAAQINEIKSRYEATLECGEAPAIDILAHLLRLNAFDRAVLLFCLAPEIDPSFEKLYAYVQDDVTRKYPTAHLALQLLGMELFDDSIPAWHSGYDSFLPTFPLRRYRLVHSEPAPGSSRAGEALRLDRRVASYLLGINRIDEQVAAVLRPLESTDLLTEQQTKLIRQFEGFLRSWNENGRMPALNLIAAPGAGRHVVARQLCNRLGIGLAALELSLLPPPGRERHEFQQVLEREALMAPTAYYLDVTEMDAHHGAEAGPVNELIEKVSVLWIVASCEPWHCNHPLTAMRIPRPDAEAQVSLWQAALSKTRMADAAMLEETLSQLAQQFDFGPQQIQDAAAAATVSARLRDSENPTLLGQDLWNGAKQLAAYSMQQLAKQIATNYTFADLVLPQDVMDQLHEIADQVVQRAQVYEKWGFGTKLVRGRGLAALFSGPSGTGKTMAAEVLANHLGLDLYRIDLAGVISKYIGETEKNLRKIFDAAEQSGAILFFDEADALFGKRSEIRDSHDRYANIEINYLLQRMEDYRGLAILATNMKSLLDQAFLRRLRFLVDFPFPDATQRRHIWQQVFPPQARQENLDFSFLSRLEIAGGNIRNVALNSAFLAARDKEPIRMEHVLHAARREYSKIDKLVREAEFGRFFQVVRR
jgi:AAA+ superfamily predicted ATPase